MEEDVGMTRVERYNIFTFSRRKIVYQMCGKRKLVLRFVMDGFAVWLMISFLQ